jgi:methionyl-tRNA formyltransferase
MMDDLRRTTGILGTLGSPLLGYTLRAFVAQGVPVGAVLLDTKGCSAKDLAIWEERTARRLPLVDLSEFASLQIPFYFLASHNSPEVASLVNRLGLDVLINGGTPRILKAETLDAPRFGILNIHPGRLPDYRGCTCVEWAVYNDDEVFNSVHLMTKTIDGGPVVLAEGYLFSSTDNYVDLRVKVYRGGFDLLARAAEKVLREGITAVDSTPQAPGGNYYKPIPDELLAEVRNKLDTGRYRYQIG